ncbi:MAG TPA: GNAT family N-acetyltransferase, partial [Nocardioidaceae bacterium]
WGSCGQLLYVDGQPAGFAMYAPPEYVAMTSPVGGSTVSDDAVLLMTARILPEYGASGLGRVLIQAVVKDLMGRRGVRAIEAFADAQGHEHTCVIPAEFLTAVGFKTVHPHPRYPRLRLDLRSVLSWRGEVEVALERWLGAIRPEKKQRPAGVSPRMNPPGPWPVP